MHETSNQVPRESDATKDKKFPASTRYNQTFRFVMDHIGGTSLNWVRKKIVRHRASKEADRVLEALLPIRLKDIGMKAMLQIPSTTGKYIIHVGQIHSESDASRDYLSPETAISQQAIERLIIEGNIPEVFEEGVFEDTDHINAGLERIRNIELTRDFVKLLPSILDQVAEHQEDRQFSIYKYAFRRRIEAFRQKCIEEGWEKEQVMADEALKTLSIEDMIIDPYKEVGGARIAQAKGKVKIYAAEEREAHSKGNDLARTIRLLRNEIFEEFVKDPNNPKIPELKKQFDKATEDFRIFDHSERERIAIQKVVQHPSFASNNVAYLVYGAAHDFSVAVRAYNQEHQANQIGLIYMSDTDTFNER